MRMHSSPLLHLLRTICPPMMVALLGALALPSEQSSEQGREVAALDQAIREQLAGRELSAADVERLARVLAQPVERIEWMLGQAEAAREGDMERSIAIAERGGRLLEDYLERGLLRGVAAERVAGLSERATMLRTAPRPKKATELAPAEIARAILAGEREAFANLSEAERFELWSLGVPESELGLPAASTDLSAARPAWLAAGWAVGEVLRQAAGSADLFELVELHERLRAARSAARGAAVGEAALRIAEEVVARAIGLDGRDYDASAAPEVAETWGRLADQVEQASGRPTRWSILARLLSGAGGAELATLRAAWQNDVAELLARGERNVANRWGAVSAVLSADAGETGERLRRRLFAADWRERQRVERRELEREFVERWNAGRRDDELLALMQRIKAAGVGAEIRPIGQVGSPGTQGSLAWHLRNPAGGIATHLYVEIVSIPPRHYAFVLAAERTFLRMSGLATHWLESDSLSGLLSAAYEKLPGQLADPVAQARLQYWIVVALDQAGAAELAAAQEALLVRVPMAAGLVDAWTVVTPTAAALDPDSGWRREDTLRYWLRVAAGLGRGAEFAALRAGGDVKRLAAPIGGGCEAMVLRLASPGDSTSIPDGDSLNAVCKAIRALRAGRGVVITLPVVEAKARGRG